MPNSTLNAIMALIEPGSVYDVPGTTIYAYTKDESKSIARQMCDEIDPRQALEAFRKRNAEWLASHKDVVLKARLGWDEEGDLCFIEDGLVSE